MTGSAGSGVEEGASSAAGAMPPLSSHAKEAPSSPLALKELLPEGSCMSMAPATGRNAMTMWACSPNGEMKVRWCVCDGKEKAWRETERRRRHQSAGCLSAHSPMASWQVLLLHADSGTNASHRFLSLLFPFSESHPEPLIRPPTRR